MPISLFFILPLIVGSFTYNIYLFTFTQVYYDVTVVVDMCNSVEFPPFVLHNA